MIFINKRWPERMIMINLNLYFLHWSKIYPIIVFGKYGKQLDTVVKNQSHNILFYLMTGHTYVPVFGLLIEELCVGISFELCPIQLMHSFIYLLFLNDGTILTSIIPNNITNQYTKLNKTN